ncbi:MAG: Asp-tRNA(Asn)/Glu-tRNA(Gln) amidotransferase subunit GatC [Chitinispirillales bacterium]|jgi:aspartyl-tRNA(Asn)/glutamyl-tRNA(Gln) amidotransferase subunit C|nr:Asp-tRNA(Asn)/Glu-tRNA(Gln) amidotransferase subunit GatC [Chitinispirillales bacterium]
MISVEIVDKIANLARLAIKPEQKDAAAKSLTDILDYVEKLSKVDTSGVNPTAYITADCGVLRDDITKEELSQEAALQNAPSAKKLHFATPKVIG